MDRELSTRNGLFFAIVVWIADLAVEGKGAQNPRESTFRGGSGNVYPAQI
jgi:hypothetical protein